MGQIVLKIEVPDNPAQGIASDAVLAVRHMQRWRDDAAISVVHVEGLPDPPPSPDIPTCFGIIVDATARIYKCTSAQILGADRSWSVVRARHLAMTACRRMTGASFPEIGRAFDRDHTTVIHGVKKMESRPGLMSMVEAIEAEAGPAARVPAR